MPNFIFPQPQQQESTMDRFMRGWQIGQQQQEARRQQEMQQQQLQMQMQQAQEALEASREDRKIRSERLKLEARTLDNKQKEDDFEFKKKQFEFKSGKPSQVVDAGQYNLDPNMAGKPLAPEAETDASATIGQPGKFQLPHQPIDFGGDVGPMAPPNQLQAIAEAVAKSRIKQEEEARGAGLKKKYEAEATEPFDQRKRAAEDKIRDDNKVFDAKIESVDKEKDRQSREREGARDRANRLAVANVAQVKPLSAESAKVRGIAETLPAEIDKLIEAYKKDYNKTRNAIFSKITDRRLSTLASNAADKVGRLRSGGAINKDEEARFMEQLGATWMDVLSGNKTSAIEALEGIKMEAEIVRNLTTTGKSSSSGGGGGGAPIVQHSESTGAYRYSTDGLPVGDPKKKWIAGRP